MAVTAIWDIKGRIDQVIRYAINPEKTNAGSMDEVAVLHKIDEVLEYTADEMKTEHRMFVSGINCDPFYAAHQFINTKRRWGKMGGIVAFHGYQSFRGGEVNAETAHRIGTRLAEELWGDRFEVVVATHLNTSHYHNHFVINSVSVTDGYKYNDCKESYRRMREASDRLCREHSLSVIEDACGKSRHYSEWSTEKNGKPTHRGMIREDIDRAISASTTGKDFIRVMTEMGYEIKTHGESGTPLKYPSLKPPGAKGYFRFHKLGEGYSLDEIKERILQNYRKKIPFPEVKPKRGRRYRYHGSRRTVKKATGLRALYLRYCYELHIFVRHPASVKRVSFLLREDVAKLDRFIAQTRLLGKQRIETYEDLCNYKAYLEGQISTLTAERNSLRNQLKRVSRQNDGIAADEIKKQITAHTAMLKSHRRELILCDSIEQRSAQVRENLEQLCREREQERKEQETNDPIRRCGGSSRPIDIGRR